MTEPPLTPAAMRDLAAAARELSARVDAAQTRLQTDPDAHRARAGYRLDEVSDHLTRAGDGLLETADDLARLAAVPGGACGIEWGVCPVHGNTLTTTGGRTWCRSPGCGRTWGYDRVGTPCAEPVTHAVLDAEGTRFEVCDGHGVDCRDSLVDAVVTVLPAAGDTR